MTMFGGDPYNISNYCRVMQSVSFLPELVGVPIVTAGDVKCNLNLRLKKLTQINKQQGYCDCCELKYKDLEQVSSILFLFDISCRYYVGFAVT